VSGNLVTVVRDTPTPWRCHQRRHSPLAIPTGGSISSCRAG
jgi:hypothetical protein